MLNVKTATVERKMVDVRTLRHEYRGTPLSINSVDRSPFRQLERWLEEAINAQIPDANAVSLATSTADGIPSCRTVLLKGLDEQGLLFFTNYNSRKSEDIKHNPQAAMTFLWRSLERQVLISGTVDRLSESESEAYWNTRPRANQLGAWASKQGEPVANRSELEQRYRDMEQRFGTAPIPKPDYWGGFRITPHRFEFWQGRPSRLHDRIEYQLADGQWKLRRLAP